MDRVLRRDPFVSVLSVAGLVLAGAAVYDVHRTLQFVGVVGLFSSLASYLNSYDSPQVRVLT